MKLVKTGSVLFASAVGSFVAALVAMYLHGDPSPASWRDLSFLVPYWGSLILFVATPLLAIAAAGFWITSAIVSIINRVHPK